MVDLAQGGGDIPHDLLEFGGHMVQRAVGEHHRIFIQTFGIDTGNQAGHGQLLGRKGHRRASRRSYRTLSQFPGKASYSHWRCRSKKKSVGLPLMSPSPITRSSMTRRKQSMIGWLS